MEEWRDVLGFEGLYKISNLGNVWSEAKQGNLKFMNNSKNKYKYVCLGKYNIKPIHRLVALSFIPNPENKLYVDHINRDRTNNNVENLRWATASENRINSEKKINKLGEENIVKDCNHYRVRIRRNKIDVLSNTYDTLQEAITARDVYLANQM